MNVTETTGTRFTLWDPHGDECVEANTINIRGKEMNAASLDVPDAEIEDQLSVSPHKWDPSGWEFVLTDDGTRVTGYVMSHTRLMAKTKLMLRV